MPRLANVLSTVALASGVAALPSPPTSYAVVPASWSAGVGVMEEFELELVSASSVDLTDVVLVGALPIATTFAVKHPAISTGVYDLTAHGYLTGDGPFLLTAATTQPGGTVATQLVWIIKIDANTFSLAVSAADALADNAIVVSDAGSGQLSLTAQAGAARMYWCARATLGPAGDGAIALAGVDGGYTTRCKHSPRVAAYALVGTLASAIDLTASISAIDELP